MIEEAHELLMFLSPFFSIWSSSRLILPKAKWPIVHYVKSGTTPGGLRWGILLLGKEIVWILYKYRERYWVGMHFIHRCLELGLRFYLFNCLCTKMTWIIGMAKPACHDISGELTTSRLFPLTLDLC